MYDKIKESISELIYQSNLNNIKILKRGNKSIKVALKIAKSLNKSKCFIQDQGGWITYPHICKDIKLKTIEINTDDCKIDLEELKNNLDSNSVLLINSLSGYWYKQPIKEIYDICKSKNTILINDCSGSISCKELLVGDILIGSFGRWKPINNEGGAFIYISENIKKQLEEKTNDLFNDDNDINNFKTLNESIKKTKKRVKELNNRAIEIINKLNNNNFKVINDLNNNNNTNLAIIVEFNNENEKNNIIKFCETENIEFTVCPRKIRILKDAISIEIKRL